MRPARFIRLSRLRCPGRPHPVRSVVLLCAVVASSFLQPVPVQAQENDWATLPAGRLRAGIDGVFWSADERFGLRTEGSQRIEEVEALALDLQSMNGSTIFPGVGALATSLQTVLGDPSWTPTLGESRSYLQMSQARVPMRLELGVTDWLTMGVTVPFVRSRLEGDLGLLPSADADVGLNPAFASPGSVQAFTDVLTERALLLPAGTAETWFAWAQAFTQAYGASALFPLAGSATGALLDQQLAAFNSVLTANGVASVTQAIPFGSDLSVGALRTLLSDPQANLGILPVPTALLWGLGDITLSARVRILRGRDLPMTRRPAWGVTALGSVRLPTAAPLETRTLMPVPEDPGVMAFTGGLAGWVRTSRFGISGAGEMTFSQSATVQRRVGPPDVVIRPRDNLAEVEWSPGRQVHLQLRPTIRMGAALWIEGSYRYLDRAGDRFNRVSPLPSPPLLPSPIPGGPTYTNATLLAAETSQTLHMVGGGLRYHPPRGEIPLEGWVRVESAIQGSGGQALKETRLSFGIRLMRRLWGSRD